jgi:hypothetical protein
MSIKANAFDFVERCKDYRQPGGVFDDCLFHPRQSGFEHLILGDVPARIQAVVLPALPNDRPEVPLA